MLAHVLPERLQQSACKALRNLVSFDPSPKRTPFGGAERPQRYMPNRDWDMERRRERVALQGAERSEYPDTVEQIAKAKGCAKVRGTNLVKCPNPQCDGYYELGHEDEHRHVKYPTKPRGRQFLKWFKKGPTPGQAKQLPKPLAVVIRDSSGQIVKRVRLH